MCSMRRNPTETVFDAARSLSAAEIQSLERTVIGSGRVAGETLMERAGRGVVEAVLARHPNAGRAVILCGPGNNGGDGYVVARMLTDAGWEVDVFALGDPSKLPPDARLNHDRWTARGAVHALDQAADVLAGADLVVDALFGVGLARPLSDDLGRVLATVPETALRVAVDVPSGWAADDDKPLSKNVFAADLVVTFHAWKPAHRAMEAAGTSLVLVDIGL